jgi:glutaredoxin
MSKPKLYVYSKDGCGFCSKLTDFMDKNDIRYEAFYLGKDFTTEEFVSKFGYKSTFPQVHVDNQNIGGMKDTVRYLLDKQYVQ